jgi:hypothetical protein
MKKKMVVLLALALVAVFVLSFTASAAGTSRGGVTPANLPFNARPSKIVSYTFSSPTVTMNTITITALTKLAFLTGDNYPGTSSALNYCVADTDDVYSALTTKYGFPTGNINYLKDSQCTDANIKAGIDWLKLNATTTSTAVWYNSGHGSRSTSCMDGDGVKNDCSIVPFDFTRIWDADLASRFNGLTSVKVWLASDTCYAGGLLVAGTTKAGRVCTMACKSTELSYESSTVKHGFFTYLAVHKGMLGGLADANADGVVTVEEAFNYANANIGTLSTKQHPVMNDQFTGDLNLNL